MFSPLEGEVLLGRDVQQGVVRTEELINIKIQFRKKPCRAEYWLVWNTSPSSMNQLSDVWVKRGDTLRGKSNAFRYSSNFTGWEAKLILISDLLQVSLVFQIACLLCSHLPPTKPRLKPKQYKCVREREGRNQWTPPLLSSSVLDRWRNESGQCYLGLCLPGGALILPWSTWGSLCQCQLYNVPWCKCIFTLIHL